eukprot:TRINITY_DN2092_c0_g2_i1.p1 TRINITY_DN2092_c0_g2~~TRINITY_DN2092_c0_g2_i1.p1  ORF type:complete len:251 (+),score=40.23 TRINITY_DN2092_c0_g2_i1:81-833(+)
MEDLFEHSVGDVAEVAAVEKVEKDEEEGEEVEEEEYADFLSVPGEITIHILSFLTMKARDFYCLRRICTAWKYVMEHSVTEISFFPDHTVSNLMLDSLPRIFPYVRTISVPKCKYTTRFLIAALGKYPRLTSLNIDNPSTGFDAAQYRIFSTLTNLTDLNADFHESSFVLPMLEGLSKLTHLSIRTRKKAKMDSLSSFLKSPGASNLRSLDLSGWHFPFIFPKQTKISELQEACIIGDNEAEGQLGKPLI